MGDLAILVPTLGRPHLIEPLLESIYATVPDAHVVFITTWNDMAAKNEIRRLGEHMIDVERRGRGDYAHKINAGYKETTEPHLFLAAQDLKFHPDWYKLATDHLTRTIQVVGTNDMGNKRVMRGQHSTHTLVTRHYVDTFGTIDEKKKVLHEGYFHEFVDDEFVETARYRDAFEMALESKVEHLHPMWGKAEWDDSYREGDKRFVKGRKLYYQRRKLWRR